MTPWPSQREFSKRAFELSQTRRHLEHHPGTNPPSFTAVVEEVTEEGGVILSESWCYPRGGGQPGDTGTFMINGKSIAFGEVTAAQSITHPLLGSGLANGDEVTCVIDRDRRNSLAKMHSAAHIVSAVANERWGAITVGNQLNTESSRMDLKFENRELFDKDQLTEDANYWVHEDVGINVHQWGRDQIMTDERVRNKRFVERIIDRVGGDDPQLRMVEVEGIDLCPCAGTHLSSTGAIGGIVVDKVQNKGKGTFRVNFSLID